MRKFVCLCALLVLAGGMVLAQESSGGVQNEPKKPASATATPMAPPNPAAAGQSDEEAEINAEAASRAEISPAGRNRGGSIGEAQQNMPALGTHEPAQRPTLANEEPGKANADAIGAGSRPKAARKPAPPTVTKTSGGSPPPQ